MSAVVNRWPPKPSMPGGPGLRALWHKAELVTTLEEYYGAQGLDPWRHHPLSFRLPHGASPGSAEWASFASVFKAVGSADGDSRVPREQSRRNLWLLKPTGGCSGKGIGIASSLDELHKHYESCKDSPQAGGSSGSWIVQKYLEAPLLYKRRKFDLRIFALLESDHGSLRAAGDGAAGDGAACAGAAGAGTVEALGFNLYAYREGYGRTSSELFSMDSLHPTMHLTNFSIQKEHKETYGRHEAGNSVSFHDLERDLGASVGFTERIVPRMHALIADAVLAGRPQLLDTLRAARTASVAHRTLLAFDLIVEADGTPLLMEINPYPGMTPQSEWHGAYLRRLLDDYVGRVVGAPAAPIGADSTRPLLDGHHVPNCQDDGWMLLLGRGAQQSGDATAAFAVVPCGSRLVRVRCVD